MSARGSTARPSPRVTSFWILQAAEILSLVALDDLSLHVNRGGVLAVGGAIFAALALTADGPLGIIRIFSRKLHVILVVVTAALIAVSPVVSAVRPDVEGILILEVAAVGIIRLATLVNTEPRPIGSRRARGVRVSGPVVDATATASPSPSPRSAQPQPGTVPPPSTGRSRFPSEESVGTAARWAGRAAGAATSAASRTSAKHGPTAKAQAKRTIRSAGWLVGRARSRSDEPNPKPG
jgi:hypothetical protein